MSEMMAMGSGKDPAGSVECCMCGDHGVTKELFRCRSCHSRHQHKYCSNLYPKAESYKSCNWCLTEEDAKKTKKISTSSATTTTTAANGNYLKRGSMLPWELDKPVKKDDNNKKKKLSRSSSSLSSPNSIVGRGRYGFRGRIRRYKLLEDVPT